MKRSSPFWNLGLFAIALLCILILYGVYFLVVYLRRSCKACETIEKKLKEKLFYSSLIRYIISAYLKLTHTAIAYFVISGSKFESVSTSFQTLLIMGILIVLIVYPNFVTIFLVSNRNKLDDADFK